MTMAYRLTRHAARRIRKRSLPAAEVAAALDGVCIAGYGGALLYGDPATRCVVVVEPTTQRILTALRYRPEQFRAAFGNRKPKRIWRRGAKRRTIGAHDV